MKQILRICDYSAGGKWQVPLWKLTLRCGLQKVNKKCSWSATVQVLWVRIISQKQPQHAGVNYQGGLWFAAFTSQVQLSLIPHDMRAVLLILNGSLHCDGKLKIIYCSWMTVYTLSWVAGMLSIEGIPQIACWFFSNRWSYKDPISRTLQHQI